MFWKGVFFHKASLNFFCCHCHNLLDMNTEHVVIWNAIHLALPFSKIFPPQVPSSNFTSPLKRHTVTVSKTHILSSHFNVTSSLFYSYIYGGLLSSAFSWQQLYDYLIFFHDSLNPPIQTWSPSIWFLYVTMTLATTRDAPKSTLHQGSCWDWVVAQEWTSPSTALLAV